MLKLILFTAIFSTVTFSFSVVAQQQPTDPEMKRIRTALDGDKDYKAFKLKLDAISKSANGRDSKVDDVKKLFAANKPLFQNLQATYRIKPLTPVKIGKYKPVDTNNTVLRKEMAQFRKYRKEGRFQRTVQPPFTEKWSYWHSAYGGTWRLSETHTNEAAGKIGFTVNQTDAYYVSSGTAGFKQDITVPSDPTILAAKITIEYSFFFTGWDTYGADFGLGLFFNASPNFNSAYVNQLPPYMSMMYVSNWKDLGELLPCKAVITPGDVVEFHADVESSFTATGYVSPGSVLTFHMGAGYIQRSGSSSYYSHRGNFGTYHYGEFIVKKITINYLKTIQ